MLRRIYKLWQYDEGWYGIPEGLKELDVLETRVPIAQKM